MVGENRSGEGAKNMKLRIWNSLMMGVVLLSLTFVTGCGTLETLVNKNGASTSLGDLIGGAKTTLPATATVPTSTEAKTVVMYFADSTGKFLVKEQRTLPKTTSVAKETVNEWLKGPAVKGATVQGLVPTTTLLRGIVLKENTVIVDLSKDFLQSNTKVSKEVALYGLVNTLTQFSTIKQVQIRIEGTPLTKYGTIDTTTLLNKASLVKGTNTSNPIIPSTGTGTTGTGVTAPDKATSGDVNSSPSSVNLFDFSGSST
jgi:hypothetical protein